MLKIQEGVQAFSVIVVLLPETNKEDYFTLLEKEIDKKCEYNFCRIMDGGNIEIHNECSETNDITKSFTDIVDIVKGLSKPHKSIYLEALL
tara:strand:+ start:260 stop:532 length:273 start_codon:yes stop_codon:yes gene_type:complete